MGDGSDPGVGGVAGVVKPKPERLFVVFGLGETGGITNAGFGASVVELVCGDVAIDEAREPVAADNTDSLVEDPNAFASLCCVASSASDVLDEANFAKPPPLVLGNPIVASSS